MTQERAPCNTKPVDMVAMEYDEMVLLIIDLQRQLAETKDFAKKAKEYLEGNYPLHKLRALIEKWAGDNE